MTPGIDIERNLERIRALVPSGVEIVAVSKFHPAEMVMEAYNAGQRHFGESRVQEFIQKEKELPKDISWHFIGHLQTNKVKPLIGKTFLIESVDSERLLSLIDKESEAAGVVTQVLLQVHVAQEEAKFGFYPEELLDFFDREGYKAYKSARICGLMGMATNTDDVARVKEDFHKIHSLFETISKKDEPELSSFNYLSMGMSGDWPVAVEERANIVRIGSAIFGERN